MEGNKEGGNEKRKNKKIKKITLRGKKILEVVEN
jgi:hypothetical protein